MKKTFVCFLLCFLGKMLKVVWVMFSVQLAIYKNCRRL